MIETAERQVPSGARELAFGLSVLVVVLIIDQGPLDAPLFEERPPDFSASFVMRSAAIAVASFSAVVGARRLAVATLAPVDRASHVPTAWPVAAAAASLAVALGSAVVLWASPSTLSDLVREDQLIEWASAGAAFAAAVLMGVSALQWRRRDGAAIAVAAMVVAAVVLALVALEEVSWFQRVLDIETPEALVERNSQGELNLHNLATGPTENLFYGGAFLFTVAWPFVLGDRRLPGRLALLTPAAPTVTIVFGGAVSTAIVFEMWNLLALQATFWMSLAVMVMIDRHRSLGRLTAVAMVVVVAIFLGRGDTMLLSWDDTEVREFVIMLNVAVYSAGVVVATRAPSVDRTTTG